MKNVLVLLLLSFFVCRDLRAAEKLGWDNGNAGDTFTAEFVLTGRDIEARLKMLPSSELIGLDLLALRGALSNTSVHSEENLVLNGYEVDAINYPAQAKIVMSRSRWRALRNPAETRQRLTLVLHEYLFMIGLDDSQFKISGRLIPLMDVKNYNPNRWWNPLNPANKISLNLEYNPADCQIDGLNFDPANSSEMIVVESVGNCGEAYRKVQAMKSSYTPPVNSAAKGSYHRYEIQVFDRQGRVLGGFSYEPEWGVCLLPQDGTCRLSGKLNAGGVDFIFWLTR